VIDIAAERTRFEAERADLHRRLRARPSGIEAARSVTRLRDGLLARLLAAADAPPGAALVALGEYGRERCAPFSEAEVLVLHASAEGAEDAEALAGRLRAALEGIGLAHAVHSALAGDAARAPGDDLAALGPIAEGRLVAGDAATFAAFDRARAELLSRSGEALLAALLRGALERRARTGGSLHVAEPDIVAGAGGLLDLALVRLSDRAGAPPVGAPLLDEDARYDLESAEERLLELRLVMHLEAGARRDRLGFDLGPRVAPMLRLLDTQSATGAERLMAELYRAVRDIERGLRAARHALSRRLAERAGFTPEHRPRRIGARFEARDGELDLARKDALTSDAQDLSPVMELFLAAQREKLDVAEPAIEAVRRALPRLGDAGRRSPRTIALLRELLSGKTRVAATLRAMQRAGYLGELLPEFGGLDGLWLPDPFHEHTVDEHSLRCVEALDGFAASREREDELRTEVLFGLRRLDIMRLAALLHDMGKGKAIDPVAKGVEMAANLALRLALSKEEFDLLAFLVGRQLDLERATEARDATAEETAARVADEVAGGDAERLDMLYLLTAADLRGTGAHALPRWKDAALTGLYQLARDRLSGARRAPSTVAERRAETIARLPRDLTAEDLDAHLALAPERYALEVEPADVALHVRLARDLARGRDPATAHVVESGLRRFWVCTRDRKGLFATIAGALAASGASIVAADAYTRADGVVLDKMTIVVPPERAGDEAFWEALEALLRDALSGARRVEDAVARARAGTPRSVAPTAPPRPAAIDIDIRISPRATVIDVGAEDRVGLLYDLAHAIAELGLDIRYSKISTRANRAADVFYVVRSGEKVTAPEELERIRAALAAAADAPTSAS